MSASILDRHLLYVTGKGGVGKTTVAAALGIAAAEQGKRTIVCEVAEQARVSRAFRREGVGREVEVQLAENLWAISIDPWLALEEWLSKQIPHQAVRVLTRSHAFQYFVAAAPGAKELITIGKVWDLAQLERWSRHKDIYDLVIVDAPASGHGIAMLRTPQTFGDIARVGPIRRQAGKITQMLRDGARTGYVAVALPEEMPVTETLELEPKLRDAVGLGLDAVIVNGVYPERFKAAEAAALAEVDEPIVAAAVMEDRRARSQRAHLRRLKNGLDGKVVTLPYLFEPEIGLDQYRELGALLARKL